jgi:oligopeptide transport system substrate-binding protein
MKKNLMIILAVVLAGGGLFAWQRNQANNRPDKMTIAYNDEIEGFDPSGMVYRSSFQSMALVNEGLTSIDQNSNINLSAAESITENETKTEYTINLKPNLKWYDKSGNELRSVKASDYVESWRRTANPKTKSRYILIMRIFDKSTDILQGKAPVESLGAEAVSDTQIKVKMSHAAPEFKELLAFPVFFPIMSEKLNENYGKNLDNSYFNGAYLPTEFSSGTGLKLSRNEKYYDNAKIKYSQIELKSIKDKTTQVNAFRSSEIQTLSVSTKEDLDANKNFGNVTETLAHSLSYLSLNTTDPVLSDVNVRKAILQGFNPDNYLSKVNTIGHKAIKGMIPSGMTSKVYGKDFRQENGDLFTIDKEASKAAIQNYKTSKNTDKVTLKYVISQTDDQKLAEYFKAEMNEIGINVEINVVPNVREVADYSVQSRQYNADYSDPYNFLGYFDSFLIQTGANGSKYNNPEFDSSLSKSLYEKDETKRWEMLKQQEKTLMNDAILVPVYQVNSVSVTIDKYTNIALPKGTLGAKYY